MKKLLLLFAFLLLSLCLLCACGAEEHSLSHHEAVAATCGAQGNAEYWSCSDCGRYFSDAAGEHEITDKSAVILPATGAHSYISTHVCEICGHALTVTDGLIYTPSADGTAYTVSGGDETVTEVRIPATYEGKPVTAIADNAFYQYRSMAAVLIPDSVTTIGARAFHGCEALTAVTLPSGVTAIGGGAFSECSALQGVYISDVGAWCSIRFADKSANPLLYAKNLYLNGAKAEMLTIPDGVVAISDYAFYNCQSLKSVTLPAGVTTVGEAAFYACSYMTDCALSSQLTSIGAEAFYFCRSLGEVSLSSKLTSIGAGAFINCSSLAHAYFAAAEGWTVTPAAQGESVALPAAELLLGETAAAHLTATYAEYSWSRAVFD